MLAWLCLSACPQGHDVTPHAPRPVRRPPPAKSSPESPRVHHQSLSSRDAPLNERPVHGCPLRRLRAPAPHAARRNITPAPVKPQGVPVRRPPTEDEPRKPPWEPSIPLIQGRNPPPPHESPACGCPLRRLRAPAPHAARHNITPAPVKPQGVPVRRPPPPKPNPQAPPSKTPRHTDRAPPSGLSPFPRLIYP